MLSNTATPKYYGEFRRKVLRNEIEVCEEISLQMNRIDALIEDPRYYYDDEAINGWILFCEQEMTLTDGSDVELLDSFKLWGEQIFAWFYFVDVQVYVPFEHRPGGRFIRRKKKKRLINKFYLIVARGAAKSLFLSFIQAYYLVCDTKTTSQITTAPTMKQAEEVMAPIRTAITRARGPFFKFLTEGSLQNTTGNRNDRVKLASTKQGIQNFLTGSIIEVKPMRIDRLQGLRCKVATVDEWLSGDTREDVIGAIEQGAAKIDNYLIVAASSEGTVRNGVGDTIKLELKQILNPEEKYDPYNIAIFYYKLDDVREVADKNMWIKANPNIADLHAYETYQLDVERAENAPASRNDILAKRFGIPMEGFTYFFSYAETQVHSHRNYKGMTCSLGGDLSQGDDFCAFTFLFPLNGDKYGIKTRSYISLVTYNRLPGAARIKYNEFIKEGTLIVMDGAVLDMMDVYDDLEDFIDANQYEVICFGYDPYNATDFIDRWCRENSSYGVEKVIQGAKTESVPLGELKILSEERLLLFDEALMSYAMGNCITMEDTNGNRKLYKRRHEQKIDNVAAMMDAYIAYKLHKEDF